MKTLRWRWAAFCGAALVLVLLALGVWWAGRTPPPSAEDQAPAAPAAPGQVPPLAQTGAVKLQGWDDKTGKQLWEVLLSRLELSENQSMATAHNMEEAVIFDQAGQAAVRLTAKLWKYDLNSKNFEVSGDVRVLSKRGIAFKTQKVNWVNAQRDLVCPGPVTAVHKNVVLRTGKLVFHTASDQVVCPAKVTITTPSARGVADGATVDLKTQTLNMTRPRMTIIDVEAAKRDFESAQRETASPPPTVATPAPSAKAGR